MMANAAMVGAGSREPGLYAFPAMPIYEYRCPNGHTFEVFQSMSEDPVTACEECGAPVERVFHPVAVHFKGSGFYTTDYARKGGGKAGTDGGSKTSDSEKSSKSDVSKAEGKSSEKTTSAPKSD
jgi:putative FmdB family regulatory protein